MLKTDIYPKKAVVRRWSSITAKKLAEAIYYVTKGDVGLLRNRPDSKDSIWGRIATRVGSKFSTQTDRFWIYLCFHGNKQGVKVTVEASLIGLRLTSKH